MKRIALAVLLGLMTTGAYAASCKIDATEKKLAGAAMNSFMKSARRTPISLVTLRQKRS